MSESSQDPLELLRTAISSEQLPKLLDATGQSTDQALSATNVVFDLPSIAEPLTLPITSSTRFNSRANDNVNLLTLQQLLYTYLERAVGNADYMRKAAAGVGAGFRPVGILDRKMVLEYLMGGQAPSGRVLSLGSKPEDKQFEGEQVKPIEAPRKDTVPQEAAPGSSAIAVKRKYVADEKDKEFCKKIQAAVEKPHTDIYDPLRYNPPGKKADFSTLRKSIFEERVKPLRESINRAKEGKSAAKEGEADGSASRGERDVPKGARKQKSAQQNIIMLSSSPTALVTMWNVKKLLEEGVYEKNEDAKSRQQAEGNRKMEDVVIIYRTSSLPNGEEKKTKYFAIDSVDVLAKLTGGPGEWSRVLCVFTTGQLWQFKAYHWSKPKELFQNVMGIYFHLSSEPPNAAVKEWNVKTFTIDPKHRHTDRPVVGAFWQAVEKARQR